MSDDRMKNRYTMHEAEGCRLADEWRREHLAQLFDLGVLSEFTVRNSVFPVLRLTKGGQFVDVSLGALERFSESMPVHDAMRRALVQLMGDWVMWVMKARKPLG